MWIGIPGTRAKLTDFCRTADCSRRQGCTWPITAFRFAREPQLKRFPRSDEIDVQIQASSSNRTDPAPFPHKRSVAKQRWLDRQHVEARKISTFVSSFKDQHLQFVGAVIHEQKIAQKLGTSSNECIESIDAFRFLLLINQAFANQTQQPDETEASAKFPEF
jgi:hypothetical protein